MSTIKIVSQEQWDSLPKSFKEKTELHIYYKGLVIKSIPTNASAVLYGQSSAELYGQSSAMLSDQSSAVLYGQSSAVLYHKSSAVLYHKSSAVLHNQSSAVLYNQSSAMLSDQSRAVLYHKSRAVLWGQSSGELYLTSVAHVFSEKAVIKKALDNSHVYYHADAPMPLELDETATITEQKEIIKPTFEQWLKRGIVYADGIYLNLINQKTIGELSIFECEDFRKEKSFVVKKGDKCAHGKTIEEAKNDLKYKISGQDTSMYSKWSLSTKVSQEEMIEAYRRITGACSFGVKNFVEGNNIPETLTVEETIRLTLGKFGNREFSEFFKLINGT